MIANNVAAITFSVTPPTATGGSTITSGGFKYHVFTSNGTFAVSAGSTSQGEVI